jgi:5'-3' exonuclease
MNEPWLVLDADYLCHRSNHTTGSLSYGGDPTGTAFGFLKTTQALLRQFQTKKIAFCWDHGKSKRVEMRPSYKLNRREQVASETKEEKESRLAMKEQMLKLRTEWLPSLGYNNNFWQDGYEGDDIVAAVVKESIGKDEAVIVGDDKDLYQLLTPKVTMWKPRAKVLYTVEDLAKQYHGIQPERWHCVKALAGCPGDNVKGIEGVGDLTAAKFLQGLLPEHLKIKKKIETELKEVWARNLPLVQLPLEGTIAPKLVEDEVDDKKWNRLSKTLGMGSLIHDEDGFVLPRRRRKEETTIKVVEEGFGFT